MAILDLIAKSISLPKTLVQRMTDPIVKAQVSQKQEVVNASSTPKPPRKMPEGLIPVPDEKKAGFKQAYEIYPGEIPKGLLEAINFQESSMGQNDSNREGGAGKEGWEFGIIKDKSGIFSDMMEKRKQGTKYVAFEEGYATPEVKTFNEAAAIAASIVTQHNRNRYGGKLDADSAVEMYDEYYKSKKGHTLSEEQKKRFREAIDYYGGEY